MKVLICGRKGLLTRAYDAGYQTVNSQRQLFEQSDVLSIHLKLVQARRGIITSNDLAAM